MKLRLCFFMLALGICGAVVQGCDDNDDNLDVLDKQYFGKNLPR